MVEIDNWVLYEGREYRVVDVLEETYYDFSYRTLILESPTDSYGYSRITVRESEVEAV